MKLSAGLILLSLSACSAPTITPTRQAGLVDGIYRVSRVIDGDTVEIENVGTLRFSTYDAPELDELDGSRQACLLTRCL